MPNENIRKMIPNSESVWMVCSSWIKAYGGVCGPMMMPARIYPSTTGCLSRLKMSVTTAAVIITTAKSCKKLIPCIRLKESGVKYSAAPTAKIFYFFEAPAGLSTGWHQSL